MASCVIATENEDSEKRLQATFKTRWSQLWKIAAEGTCGDTFPVAESGSNSTGSQEEASQHPQSPHKPSRQKKALPGPCSGTPLDPKQAVQLRRVLSLTPCQSVVQNSEVSIAQAERCLHIPVHWGLTGRKLVSIQSPRDKWLGPPLVSTTRKR